MSNYKPAWNNGMKGLHLNPKTEWKKGFTPPGSIVFKKGMIPWNKGKSLPKREKSCRWKGGRTLHQGKYWLILMPEHPLADKKGYVREHRIVMEKKLGRILDREEIVHHINGNSMDNSPENLELVTRSEHIKIHRQELYVARWNL